MLQDVNVRNQSATYSINVPYDVQALLLKKKKGGESDKFDIKHRDKYAGQVIKTSSKPT